LGWDETTRDLLALLSAQNQRKTNKKIDQKNNLIFLKIEFLVGETGFEPATSCSQSKRATGLRHSPTWGFVAIRVVGPAGLEPAT
jgi:hypothetical protein